MNLRSPAGALFIGGPKLSRSAQRRKNPERPENSARKFSTLASLSLALVSFPSRAWRLPVYFQRGLFNSNRQPARLAKSVLARKKKREREGERAIATLSSIKSYVLIRLIKQTRDRKSHWSQKRRVILSAKSDSRAFFGNWRARKCIASGSFDLISQLMSTIVDRVLSVWLRSHIISLLIKHFSRLI